MNKKLLLIFALLTLALSACVPALGSGESQPAATGPTTEHSLTVNGVGNVNIEPDIASLSIGVNTQNEDASSAVNANSRQVETLTASLAEMGVAAEDTNTVNFSIWARQDYDFEGNPTATTYVVDNTLQVTIRDLDALGEILDAAIEAGANNIYGIQFDVSNREEVVNQAMQLAVDNAAARAGNLAGASDVTLGEVVSVSSFVGGAGIYNPFIGGLGGGGGAVESAVPISTGQLTITVEVTISYQISAAVTE